MEELFKSLSENVSEECFDDIMGIVEELLNEDIIRAIDKKYDPILDKAVKRGKKAYSKDLEKKWKLLDKAKNNQHKEKEEAMRNTAKQNPEATGEQISSFIEQKRNSNKNIEGEKYTNNRRVSIAKKEMNKAEQAIKKSNNPEDTRVAGKLTQNYFKKENNYRKAIGARNKKTPSEYKSIDIQHDSKYPY